MSRRSARRPRNGWSANAEMDEGLFSPRPSAAEFRLFTKPTGETVNFATVERRQPRNAELSEVGEHDLSAVGRHFFAPVQERCRKCGDLT